MFGNQKLVESVAGLSSAIKERSVQDAKDHKEMSGNIDKVSSQAGANHQDVKNSLNEIKSQFKEVRQELGQNKNIAQIQLELLQLAKKCRQVDEWQCKKILIEGEQIASEIRRQQTIHDESNYRPCGDVIPCLGFFEPKRSNARKKIERLNRFQKDNQDAFQQCRAHFNLDP